MKKFGRKAQYYKELTKTDNLYENIYDFDFEDPVDVELSNQILSTPNNDHHTSIKSNHKIQNDSYKTTVNKPKYSNYKTNNNDCSTEGRYIRLSELDDMNPYNWLNVSQMASGEEIRKAYKSLILINHPDKGGSAEKFNKIHEAYEMLSNPVTKNIIDTFGAQSIELVQNILINNLLQNKGLVDDMNLCIKQNDFPQLYFLVNNFRT